MLRGDGGRLGPHYDMKIGEKGRRRRCCCCCSAAAAAAAAATRLLALWQGPAQRAAARRAAPRLPIRLLGGAPCPLGPFALAQVISPQSSCPGGRAACLHGCAHGLAPSPVPRATRPARGQASCVESCCCTGKSVPTGGGSARARARAPAAVRRQLCGGLRVWVETHHACQQGCAHGPVAHGQWSCLVGRAFAAPPAARMSARPCFCRPPPSTAASRGGRSAPARGMHPPQHTQCPYAFRSLLFAACSHLVFGLHLLVCSCLRFCLASPCSRAPEGGALVRCTVHCVGPPGWPHPPVAPPNAQHGRP